MLTYIADISHIYIEFCELYLMFTRRPPVLFVLFMIVLVCLLGGFMATGILSIMVFTVAVVVCVAVVSMISAYSKPLFTFLSSRLHKA